MIPADRRERSLWMRLQLGLDAFLMLDELATILKRDPRTLEEAMAKSKVFPIGGTGPRMWRLREVLAGVSGVDLGPSELTTEDDRAGDPCPVDLP